jgi:hypothetical protein
LEANWPLPGSSPLHQQLLKIFKRIVIIHRDNVFRVDRTAFFDGAYSWGWRGWSFGDWRGQGPLFHLGWGGQDASWRLLSRCSGRGQWLFFGLG